jgi:hypothetical protein
MQVEVVRVLELLSEGDAEMVQSQLGQVLVKLRLMSEGHFTSHLVVMWKSSKDRSEGRSEEEERWMGCCVRGANNRRM